MTSAFRFGNVGDNNLTQPDTNGEKLIFRSTEETDNNITITVSGDISGTPGTDSLVTDAVDARVENDTTYEFESLSQISLSAPCAGDIQCLGQGAAADGRIVVDTVPADGDTVRITLAGLTDYLYTFRSPARLTIQCLATAGIAQGDFFDITVEGFAQRFWFDIDNAGTSVPSTPSGGTRNEVDIATGDTAAQVAVKLQLRIAATISAKIASAAPGADTITITGVKLGVVTIADGTAATGFTFTTIAAGTAIVNGQIRTGYTPAGVAVAVNDIAGYLDRSIDSDGILDTEYSNGAAIGINAYVTAEADGDTITLTDRLAVKRQLGWNIVQTVGATLTIVPMAGGVNGVTLATIPAGSTQIYDPFEFETHDLGSTTLPALLEPTSEAIQVGSASVELHLKMENCAGITFRIEWTDDPANAVWAICAETSGGITVDDKPATAPYILPLAVKGEYFRFVITDNPNNLPIALDARLNWPT